MTRRYVINRFGVDELELETASLPEPGPGEILLKVKAFSLNYRDLLVISGRYNPRLPLPAWPVSDGAGVVAAVGEGVERVAVGDSVLSHYATTWIDGPYRGDLLPHTLGTPGAGLAAEEVILPAEAVVAMPKGYDFAEAATLPIAAITAWSALVTEGGVQAGQTILTLGTGGVSIFAVQLGKALGARVIITSSQDEKLERARALGADIGINYQSTPRWAKEVLRLTDGAGADVVVENGGAETLTQSLRATRPGGVVALLGALTGLQASIDIAPILMRRIRVAGVFVDSRKSLETLIDFLQEKEIRPVIGERFSFENFPDALRSMERGQHFGKIVVELR